MTAMRIGKLDVQVVAGDPVQVTLAGRLDDAAHIGDLAQQIPAGRVTIDTDGVVFVNSLGAREWMRLLRALHGRGDRVQLARIAEVLLVQMNLIPEFRQAATILSFHAPYACASCGAEASPVIDAIAHGEALRDLRAPQVPCPECGSPMELGDFPERYLTVFKGLPAQ
jgi:hypothetical protein